MTYFLACIEPRLFLVTVCDGRRAERDGGVNSFIQVRGRVLVLVLILELVMLVIVQVLVQVQADLQIS